MSITGRVRTPIPNNKFLHKSESIVGEIKEYKLSPEQLEEYNRTGIFPSKDKEKESVNMTIVNKLDLLKERYPDLKSLHKSKEGKSMTQWAQDNGMSNSYYFQLKKLYVDERKKAAEPKLNTSTYAVPYCGSKPVKVESDCTPEEEETIKERLSEIFSEDNTKDAAPELEYADNYMIQFNDELEAECSTLDEAIVHIKNRHNLLTVGGVRLYKEIPFSMKVNVVVGK